MISRLYNSIEECIVEWDKFLPLNHHLRSHHLAVLEKCALKNVDFQYAIITNERGEVVAIAYFQNLHFHSEHYSFPLAKNFLLQKIEMQLMKKGFNILVCGNMLHVNSPGLFFDASKVDVNSVMSQMNLLFKKVNPRPHAILIKDWNHPSQIDWSKRLGFQAWNSDLTMTMKIRPEWKSFNDYISSLRHRYAQRARKVTKMLAPVYTKNLTLEEVKMYKSQLESLYMGVVEKQSIRMIIVNGNYFVMMKENYGDAFRVNGYFLDERLVAFSSNLIEESFWELHYIGIDYSFNTKHLLYFNIMFDSLNNAIVEGKTELELGRTAREAKTTLGAQPSYFNNFIKVRGRVPTLLIRILKAEFNRRTGGDLKVRSPFKNL